MKKTVSIILCLLLLIGCGTKSTDYKKIDKMMKDKGYNIFIQNSAVTISNRKGGPGYLIAIVSKDGVIRVYYADNSSAGDGGEVYLDKKLEKEVYNKQYYKDYKKFLSNLNLSNEEFIGYIYWFGKEITKEKDEAMRQAKSKTTVCKGALQDQNHEYTLESKKDFIMKMKSVISFNQTMDEETSSLINSYKQASEKAKNIKGILINIEENNNKATLTLEVDFTLITMQKLNEIMSDDIDSDEQVINKPLDIFSLSSMTSQFKASGLNCK